MIDGVRRKTIQEKLWEINHPDDYEFLSGVEPLSDYLTKHRDEVNPVDLQKAFLAASSRPPASYSNELYARADDVMASAIVELGVEEMESRVYRCHLCLSMDQLTIPVTVIANTENELRAEKSLQQLIQTPGVNVELIRQVFTSNSGRELTHGIRLIHKLKLAVIQTDFYFVKRGVFKAIEQHDVHQLPPHGGLKQYAVSEEDHLSIEDLFIAFTDYCKKANHAVPPEEYLHLLQLLQVNQCIDLVGYEKAKLIFDDLCAIPDMYLDIDNEYLRQIIEKNNNHLPAFQKCFEDSVKFEFRQLKNRFLLVLKSHDLNELRDVVCDSVNNRDFDALTNDHHLNVMICKHYSLYQSTQIILASFNRACLEIAVSKWLDAVEPNRFLYLMVNAVQTNSVQELPDDIANLKVAAIERTPSSIDDLIDVFEEKFGEFPLEYKLTHLMRKVANKEGLDNLELQINDEARELTNWYGLRSFIEENTISLETQLDSLQALRLQSTLVLQENRVYFWHSYERSFCKETIRA